MPYCRSQSNRAGTPKHTAPSHGWYKNVKQTPRLSEICAGLVPQLISIALIITALADIRSHDSDENDAMRVIWPVDTCHGRNNTQVDISWVNTTTTSATCHPPTRTCNDYTFEHWPISSPSQRKKYNLESKVPNYFNNILTVTYLLLLFYLCIVI